MAWAYNLNIHISLGPDMQRFFEATSPYLTWAVLASLGVMMTFTALTSDDPRVFHQLVHPSGAPRQKWVVTLSVCFLRTRPFSLQVQRMSANRPHRPVFASGSAAYDDAVCVGVVMV
jgi:hypothetical protein